MRKIIPKYRAPKEVVLPDIPAKEVAKIVLSNELNRDLAKPKDPDNV